VIIDDETVDGHFTAADEGRLLTTAAVAAGLDMPVRKLRPFLHGMMPAATRTRGGGAPPERLWAPEVVEVLRGELGLPPVGSAPG
jgi:hypothetical protein